MKLQQTAVAAIIGGALALVSPSPAQAVHKPEPPAAPAKEKDKKSIEDRLTEIEKKLVRIVETLDGKKDADGFTNPYDRGICSEVKELKNEVASLKKQLGTMRKSTSLRPATTIADPMAGKGTVRIVNDYPVEITIVINEKSYRVPANTELKVTVPAGEFSYLLLSSGVAGASTRSSIKEKEVVTLRIK